MHVVAPQCVQEEDGIGQLSLHTLLGKNMKTCTKQVLQENKRHTVGAKSMSPVDTELLFVILYT